jgi:hypothetical protein
VKLRACFDSYLIVPGEYSRAFPSAWLHPPRTIVGPERMAPSTSTPPSTPTSTFGIVALQRGLQS